MAIQAHHNDTHSDGLSKASPRAPRKPIRYRRKLSMADSFTEHKNEGPETGSGPFRVQV
jgi:hypothetical protein